jgi:serine phosphatase RsbU (regulator of sigma subunit)
MQKIPKYKGLRIYLIAFVLYYMLISPMSSMLYLTNFPKTREYTRFLKKVKHPTGDSLDVSFSNNKLSINKDTTDITAGESIFYEQNNTENKNTGGIIANKGKYKQSNYFELETLFLSVLLLVFVLGFLYALPFKIFFYKKKRNQHIPAFIENFCKKTLVHSPTINAGIVSLAFIITNGLIINKLYIVNNFTSDIRRDTYFQYWIVFLVAGLLTTTFVYYWHKHRVQIKYIEFVYSKEALKKRIFPNKTGKIGFRLVISSTLTTLLPLSIVVTYILLSLSSLKSLNIYMPSQTEMKIVFGGYYQLFDKADLTDLFNEMNLFYINVPDTFFMFIGIAMGIFVSIVYLLFFVYWSNSTLINPITELLNNMQKTTGGKLNNFSIVRTNDEIGELAENYNIMTSKLNDYISNIAKMNAELEDRVRERTAEIEAQKEEIKAQRDEVESQRDKIEEQKDYVIKQRDLIGLKNKAITDSIEYASTIQKALLPPEELMDNYLSEHFILYKPRDIVSGDFYWVNQTESKPANDRTIIVAADCTGHGVPGAFLSLLGISYLNEIIIDNKEYNPAEILNKLKRNIIKSLRQTGEIGKSRDGIDIAICAIDYKNLNLQYAGAYNSIYIVRKKGSNIQNIRKNEAHFRIEKFENHDIIEIKADRIPIGSSPKQNASFNKKEFSLEKDDMIYLFSDGYIDQFGGDKRLKFMSKRFKQSLVSVCDLPAKKQRQELTQILNNWMGTEKQIDDILVIGIRI